MEFIAQLLSEELLHALGWTVLHSLWQASLIALLLGGLQLWLRRHAANTRYLVAWVALVLVLVTSLGTFWWLFSASATVDPGLEPLEALLFAEQTVAQGHFLQAFVTYFNQHIPLIVLIWFLGASFFLLRILGGLIYLNRLKTHHLRAVEGTWQIRLTALARRLRIDRKVELFESALVKVPMMLGHLKPVILLPAGALLQLEPAQLEAILAHELAHIRRNDYLYNLIQSIIEVLFYFNPAVWLISAQIRTERENCCDDIAVDLCGNSLAYAKALVSLQEMSRSAPNLALAFSNRNHRLLNRVRRILNQPQNRTNIMEKFTATLLLLVAFTVLSFSSSQALERPDRTSELHEIILIEEVETITDTVPHREKQRIFKKDEQETIELLIEDGEIRELKIDGNTIPESEYPKYESLIEPLRAEVPVPPAPPLPPVAPEPPLPPNAPAPPTPPGKPEPPQAPAPPTPPSKKQRVMVTSEADPDGRVLVWVEGPGEEELEFEFDLEQDPNVFLLDGEVVALDEQAVIIRPEPGLKTHAFAYEFAGKGAEFFPESPRHFVLRSNPHLLQNSWRVHRSEPAYDVAIEALQDVLEKTTDKSERKTLEKALSALQAERDAASEKSPFHTTSSRFQATGPRAFSFPLPYHQALREELQKDGVDVSKILTFDLSEAQLLINGVKQSEAMHEKYLQLYRERFQAKPGQFQYQWKERLQGEGSILREE